jgi:cytochrome c
MTRVSTPLHRRLVAGLIALATTSAGAGAALAQPAAPPADFAVCSACHESTAKAAPSVGPNLFAVGGRKAGAAPDFDYSDALKNSTTIWSADTLSAFILDPAKAVPGNKMDYGGASDAKAAKAIADYLMTLKG